MSKDQAETALHDPPGLLEVAAYTYFYGGFMVGPQVWEFVSKSFKNFDKTLQFFSSILWFCSENSWMEISTIRKRGKFILRASVGVLFVSASAVFILQGIWFSLDGFPQIFLLLGNSRFLFFIEKIFFFLNKFLCEMNEYYKRHLNYTYGPILTFKKV